MKEIWQIITAWVKTRFPTAIAYDVRFESDYNDETYDARIYELLVQTPEGQQYVYPTSHPRAKQFERDLRELDRTHVEEQTWLWLIDFIPCLEGGTLTFSVSKFSELELYVEEES